MTFFLLSCRTQSLIISWAQRWTSFLFESLYDKHESINQRKCLPNASEMSWSFWWRSLQWTLSEWQVLIFYFLTIIPHDFLMRKEQAVTAHLNRYFRVLMGLLSQRLKCFGKLSFKTCFNWEVINPAWEAQNLDGCRRNYIKKAILLAVGSGCLLYAF